MADATSPTVGADGTGASEGSNEAAASESLVEQLSRRLKTALDQKSYVEEVLRSTEKKLSDHQERLETALAASRQADDQLRTRSPREAGADLRAWDRDGRD